MPDTPAAVLVLSDVRTHSREGDATRDVLRGTFTRSYSRTRARGAIGGEAQHVTATEVDMLGRTIARAFDADVAAGSDVAITVDAARLARARTSSAFWARRSSYPVG